MQRNIGITAIGDYRIAGPAMGKLTNLILMNQIKSNGPYDIIAANHKAMVVTSDGLYQYDYNFISNIRLLSFLPAKK